MATKRSAKKTVSFHTEIEIKILNTWVYAHQQARKGTWHIDAVDRMRFQRRVEITKNILDPILNRHINRIQNFCGKAESENKV